LIDQAIEGPGGQDQRAELRIPYFGPVTVRLDSADSPRVSAFTRDLSPLGIGLLHIMPLEPGQVVLELPAPAGGHLVLAAQIIWCKDCGEGWYVSGARFLDVLSK
jgi:hypothetical protein